MLWFSKITLTHTHYPVMYRTINHTLETLYYYNPNTKIVCLTPNVYIDHGLKQVIWMIALFAPVRILSYMKD